MDFCTLSTSGLSVCENPNSNVFSDVGERGLKPAAGRKNFGLYVVTISNPAGTFPYRERSHDPCATVAAMSRVPNVWRWGSEWGATEC